MRISFHWEELTGCLWLSRGVQAKGKLFFRVTEERGKVGVRWIVEFWSDKYLCCANFLLLSAII